VGGSPPNAANEGNIKTIEGALDGLGRVLTRARLHDQLTGVAGVEIDRAGATLLYRLLSCPEDLRLRDLAERLCVDAPVVTRKVQQLEAQGLIHRIPDPVDGRAVRVQVTEAGREVIERLLETRRNLYRELLADWPAEEQEEFARLLSRFSEDLGARVGVHSDR
jgi:DNA-binding MarR family transcriptional regulator